MVTRSRANMFHLKRIVEVPGTQGRSAAERRGGTCDRARSSHGVRSQQLAVTWLVVANRQLSREPCAALQRHPSARHGMCARRRRKHAACTSECGACVIEFLASKEVMVVLVRRNAGRRGSRQVRVARAGRAPRVSLCRLAVEVAACLPVCAEGVRGVRARRSVPFRFVCISIRRPG